jgi:hypothetical protein
MTLRRSCKALELINKTTANMGFSAMLAEEYVLIDISLSAAVRAERINLNKRI